MVNVLIAEDDFRVASLHEKFLLKLSDIQIVGKAKNAEETIQFIQNHVVDLLILDVYLPDELGTDLLPKIRELAPQTDIIIVTASVNKDFLLTAIRYGVFNYLIKPVSLEKFTEIIENYKNKQFLLEAHEELDQAIIDHYFSNQFSVQESQGKLPKGIDQLTLQKVVMIMEEGIRGISAEEVAMKMGASRTTARRYLEYLISIGSCRAELEYGIVGRPERKYYPHQQRSTPY